jgi:hypothetical protein
MEKLQKEKWMDQAERKKPRRAQAGRGEKEQR